MKQDETRKYVDEFLRRAHGQWKLERILGRGKSAVVYLVSNAEQSAALKIYLPQYFQGENAAIEKRRVEDQLSLKDHGHETLVNIIDAGPIFETYYLAMEYIPFYSLALVLKKVPANNVRQIICDIASAAKFLEDKGFVHRDIKPENIVISDDFSSAILLDLGVIRPISPEEVDGTDQGLRRPFVATAQYSSPEYLFRLIEPSPDLWRGLTFYQLGAVLHDLIMKEPIFQAEMKSDNRYVVAWAVNQKIPTVQNESVDSDLIALARNCLSKDLQQRLTRVGWDQFNLDNKVSLEDARKRLGLGAGNAGKVVLPDKHVLVEKRKIELQGISDKLLDSIKKLMANDGFPPAGTNVSVNSDTKACIAIFFKPIHAEKSTTLVFYYISLLRDQNDYSQLAIYIHCLLTSDEADLKDYADAESSRPIWVTSIGEFEADLEALLDRLDVQFIALYDKADSMVHAYEENTDVGPQIIELDISQMS